METELLLKTIKNTIAILPAIISSVSSIYVFSKRPNQSIARERLETVIFPIFECLGKFPNYENTKQFRLFCKCWGRRKRRSFGKNQMRTAF